MIRFTWSREIPRCWHLSSLWLLISMRSLLYFLKTMNRQLCADALPHIYASSNPSVEIEVAEIVKIVVGRVVEATMFGYSLQVTFKLLAFFLESDGQSLDVLAHLTPKFFNRNRLTKGILTEL